MPPTNQEKAQAEAPESGEYNIEVDLGADDPAKTITRRPASDIAAQVRDDAEERRPERGAAPIEDRKTKEMRKRLARERRAFSQRLANAEAASQRQIADLRAEVDRLKLDRGAEADASQLEAQHEAAIKLLQEQLAAATEKGDSAEQARLTVAINKEFNTFAVKQARAAGVTSRADANGGGAGTSASTAQPTGRVSGPTAAGSRFILANEEWWDDPDYELEQLFANQLFVKLTGDPARGIPGEGYGKNDDATFAEIARRVRAKFPTLDIHAGREDAEADAEDGADEEDESEGSERQAGQRRQPTRGTEMRRSRAGATGFDDRGVVGARKGLAIITPKDQATMRAMGLSPDKNEHVLQFLHEKQADAGREGAR